MNHSASPFAKKMSLPKKLWYLEIVAELSKHSKDISNRIPVFLPSCLGHKLWPALHSHPFRCQWGDRACWRLLLYWVVGDDCMRAFPLEPEFSGPSKAWSQMASLWFPCRLQTLLYPPTWARFQWLSATRRWKWRDPPKCSEVCKPGYPRSYGVRSSYHYSFQLPSSMTLTAGAYKQGPAEGALPGLANSGGPLSSCQQQSKGRPYHLPPELDCGECHPPLAGYHS